MIASRRREEGVADIVGTILTVGIAVLLSGAVGLAIMNIPPPQKVPHTALQALVLPTSPSQLVIEDEGGDIIPFSATQLDITVGTNTTNYNLATVVKTLPATWQVVPETGGTRPYTASLQPGDQIRFTNPSIASGLTITVLVVDASRNGVAMPATAVVQPGAGATVGPTFPSITSPAQARTVTPTTFTANFTTPLASVLLSDFSLTGGHSITAYTTIGTGSEIQFTVSPAFTSSETPTLSTIASPTGTKSIYGKLLQGSKSITLADGIPPGITAGPTASVSQSGTATITWTTDEPATSLLDYGPLPTEGLFASTSGRVTTHSITVSGLIAGTRYNYTAITTDAQGSTTTASASFTTPPPNPNPTFTTGTIHLAYATAEQAGAATQLAINIMNPTNASVQFNQIWINASPGVGTGYFASGVSSGAGSDTPFSGCAWGATPANTVHCKPTSFTIPPGAMSQLVLNFKTTSAGTTNTVLAAQVQFSNPTTVVNSNYWNVVHAPTSDTDELILPLSGSGGNLRGSFPPVTRSTPSNFYMQLTFVGGSSAAIYAHITIPAGWTNVTVPAQPSLNSIGVRVLEPTVTSSGEIDLGTTTQTTSFYFTATPPSSPGIYVMPTEMEIGGSKSSNDIWPSLSTFAVVVQ
ncbi:MAG: type IV pilin [Thermoplasmatota archaeon]